MDFIEVVVTAVTNFVESFAEVIVTAVPNFGSNPNVIMVISGFIFVLIIGWEMLHGN